MTMRATLLGSAAALLVSASAHAATPNGWYVSLEGGASWADDVSGNETCTGCGTVYRFNEPIDTGWAVLATVGMAWDNWRFEGEAGYRSANIEKIAFITGSATTDIDDLRQFTLMANMLYDIPVGDKFSVSVGAGVGVDRISFKWPAFGAHGWRDDDWEFAWQGIVGLNYALTPSLDLFVDYRYLSANGPDFHITDGAAYTQRWDDVVTQTASAGLRWHF